MEKEFIENKSKILKLDNSIVDIEIMGFLVIIGEEILKKKKLY